MEYETRVDSKQGTYIVTDSLDFEKQLENRGLTIDGLIVQVGESTDLYGWFTEPLRFCGFLDNNQAIFYLGQGDSDLFNTGAFYYDVTTILALDRIGKSYKLGTFRDMFLRKNNDKKYWK